MLLETPERITTGRVWDSVARESNTQNNCSAGVSVVVTGSAEVGPDLVVESPTVDYSRVAPDETFDLSVTVRNQGECGVQQHDSEILPLD